MKITRGVIFVLENYQIVVFFKKKIWGAFWRFLAWKGALPDSELLETLLSCWSPAVAEARNSIKSLSIFSCILIWYSFIEQILFYWFQVWQQAAITNKGEHPTNFKLNPKVPAKKVLGRISFSLVKQMFQTLNWSKISNGIRPTVKAFLKMTGNSKLL